METKWTLKGKPKDGWYFKCKCPRCGKVDACFIRSSNIFVCANCNNHKGVELIERC